MEIILALDPSDYGVSYPFQVSALLIGLTWAVWVVLNLWIWQKTKARGNLLMLIGSAVLAFTYVLRSFTWKAPDAWLELLALVTLSFGFFLSVRPMVEAHLAKLKERLHHATGPKKDGGQGS